MIGYLKGSIKYISSQSCIVLSGNVGYEVFVPTRTLQKLVLDSEWEFFVYTHVREDIIKLFGFDSIKEKEMFEMIISVSGVGPKIGLSIMSAASPSEMANAISKAEVGFFTNLKGLGKKNAQKIIVELKNKIGSVTELDLAEEESKASEDVIEALMGFGFKRRDILIVLKNVDPSLSESEQIKIALRELGK
jgi:Holliday junction DNA helicase RuvA